MCGITGYISNNNNSKISENLIIQKMTNSLKHRGPDDEGYALFNANATQLCYGNDTPQIVKESHFPYSPKIPIENALSQGNNLALGHRRLSIIDLSPAGHQPMSYDADNLCCVYNGEIYNYIEIRNELMALGHTFISGSDTEVLLASYKEYGIRCLEKFNGMWAFVIYDKAKNILFGARDRFGVKPLYFSLQNDFFAFASEPKALLTIPQNKPQINQSAVYEYLALATIENQTNGFYENILELLPSELFVFDINSFKLTCKKYYSLQVNTETHKLDRKQFEVYSKNVQEHLFNAIELRLRSDVPIGFCLSGGLDSSTLVSIADLLHKKNNIKQLGVSINAFTAINDDLEKDESKWAQLVVDHCNVSWHQAQCNSVDLLVELPKIIYQQDVPLVSTGTYAQYKVMQRASECKIPILIDGQGGDELFAGYLQFFVSQCLNFIKRGDFISLYNELKRIQNSPISGKLYVVNCIKIFAESLPIELKKIIFKKSKPEMKWIHSDFEKWYKTEISLKGNFNSMDVNSLLKGHFTDYYLKGLLRWEDRCSMAFGIESRTPFADDIRLIEYIFSIPSRYKIVDGWSKSLLRSATRTILPEKIRTRTDKLGYATPHSDWIISLNKHLKSIIASIDDTDTIIRKTELLNNWDKIVHFGNDKERFFIWRYANYLLWKNGLSIT
jgi:asparagine synthase (glutamine-hydrolysing)